MNCYGQYGTNDLCTECLWQESCSYFSKSSKELPAIKAVSLNALKKVTLPVTEPEEPVEVTISDLATFLNWLLRCDEYTLGIIQEIVTASEPMTVSQLAARSGVSRAAMHRKILHIISNDKRLAPLFIALMPKLSKARKRFLRKI
jgi:hypothetical protein